MHPYQKLPSYLPARNLLQMKAKAERVREDETTTPKSRALKSTQEHSLNDEVNTPSPSPHVILIIYQVYAKYMPKCDEILKETLGFKQ